MYAFRKFVLLNYIEMIDFEDNLYRNKFARYAAIGLIKTTKQIAKVAEEEKKKVEKEHEEYLKSDEYKKLT